MHPVLRNSAESLLCAIGLPTAGRYINRDRTLVLAYHDIVEAETPVQGDRSLHLRRSDFACQLDLLLDYCEVVPLDRVLVHEPARKPRVAITFDDAYRGAVTHGVAELAERGLPATIFVAPAFLGGHSFWWDALADTGSGLPEDIRNHALNALAGSDERIRAWAHDNGRTVREPPMDMRAASIAELKSAARVPGITFGSHTRTHPNLARLEMPDLEDELRRSLVWLQEHFDNVIPWISYPYGLSTSQVRRTAREVGYTAGCEISGGWVRGRLTQEGAFEIPRANIPAGKSARGFKLLLSGLVPARTGFG